MEDYKVLLAKLYKEYAPEKVDQIDFYLDRYKGKEKQFYITQKAKYTNKKTTKDSKKILEEAMARIAKRKEEATAQETTQNKKSTSPKEVIIPKTVLVKPETNDREKEDIIIPKKTIKEQAKKEDLEERKPLILVRPEIDEQKNLENYHQLKKPGTIPPKDMEDSKKHDFENPKKIIQEEAPRKEEEKKKRPIFWYVILVTFILFIISLLVYLFAFNNKWEKEKETINIQKVAVENESSKKKNTEDKTKQIDQTQEKEAEQDPQKTEEPKSDTDLEQAKGQKKEKKIKTQTSPSTKPSADRIYASDINKPAIFVGCFAIKEEALAQKKVASLKAMNLDAHYYWIPDMDNKGNPFFKVVIGPFTTAQEAYPSLTKVQERVNFDAYIIVVN